MTEKKRTNFLGIPISGDVDHGYHRRTEQKPQSELEPIIRAVLDDPFMIEFGWQQYTPYFNDGDPCEFSAHGFWIRTQEDPPALSDPEEGDYEEVDPTERWSLDYEHPTLGSRNWRNDYAYEGTRETQFDLANTLAIAIEGGAFENVLLELFGDHCTVTVGRDGIVVEGYSHG